ncbi:acyl-CoA dehydratase activase [Clostridium carnis]
MYKLGIDAGSTTVKLVLLDNNNKIIYKSYKRHYTKIKESIINELYNIVDIVNEELVSLSITGSAGYGISKEYDIPFVQEVFATTLSVKNRLKDVDVVIELGGEDAKIIYISNGLEERMNSSCAGGTGAFIDQMASLMGITVEELDTISLNSSNIYPIASRCGVFAKSDIQPLLNQGASKSDIAASIYEAVVNQTIGGLAQGRKIEGKVAFLGGPLYFYRGLQKKFKEILNIESENQLLPENAEVYVALGAAIFSYNEKISTTIKALIEKLSINNSQNLITKKVLPLFNTAKEYKEFIKRHNNDKVLKSNIDLYNGNAYLGIDAGSTTTKVVLISDDNKILYEYYSNNKGNPVDIILKQLKFLNTNYKDKINIISSAVTGYGEDLIKNAFNIDFGIVETLAHYIAAKYFNPNVDFILDIGGQDIKCFEIKNKVLKSIILNEACSSGCGSFIETFATGMGYTVEEFSKLGLFSKHPADLGSRCTVFMNSSVKQAQRNGASIEDVSAGLSISVVKNALYKVLRNKIIGDNIVVQGGTMYNDAILRSLEIELGKNVIRSNISGLMGAYGAALYSKENKKGYSNILKSKDLSNFTHVSKGTRCGMCSNKCNLTINIFNTGDKYISGNKCTNPLGKKVENLIPNIYEYKYKKIHSYKSDINRNGEIGIPLVLNMYENLPFFITFFKELGIKVVLSAHSSKELYLKGQYTIPSDTVCYPAKLSHGHIIDLLEKGIKNIFYPCMTYNFNENISDNNFNCPVVAYYPEVLKSNINELKDVNYISPYLDLNLQKNSIRNLYSALKITFSNITQNQVKHAFFIGLEEYRLYKNNLIEEGEKALKFAKENNILTIVLAGRPYHIDKEVNHGIDKMINSLGLVVIPEDSINTSYNKLDVDILNQWTYQARLLNIANTISNMENISLIQLVSFGCGTDAIISDEIKKILEEKDKIYTQIKIDETNNLGAAKIRVRSMVEAIKSR